MTTGHAEIVTPEGMVLPEVPPPVVEHAVSFQVGLTELEVALAALSVAAPGNRSEVDDAVLFEAAGGELTATVDRYDRRATYRLGRVADRDGRVAVRYTELRRVLAAMGKGKANRDRAPLEARVASTVTLSQALSVVDRFDATREQWDRRWREYTGALEAARSYTADLSCDGYRLPLEPRGDAESFRPSRMVEEKNPSYAVSVDRAELLDLLTRIVPTAGTDDTLPGLTGVVVHVPRAAVLSLAATNRYVATEGSIAARGAGESIIPLGVHTTLAGKPLLAAVKRMTGERVMLTLARCEDGWSSVSDGITTVEFRDLHGETRYGRLLGLAPDASAVVSRTELVDLVTRSAALSAAKTGKDAYVWLLVDTDMIAPIPALEGVDPEDTAAPSTPAELSGLPRRMWLRFDPAVLLAALAAVRGERVRLAWRGHDVAKMSYGLMSITDVGVPPQGRPGWFEAIAMPVRHLKNNEPA